MTLVELVRFEMMRRRARRAPVDDKVLAALRARERAAEAEHADRLVLPPDDELVALCWHLADAVGAPSAFFSVVTGDRQTIKAGINLPHDARIGQPVPLAYSVCALVAAHDEPLSVRDVDREPALERCLVLGGLRAYNGAPVEVHGRAIGAVAAASLQPRAWTVADDAEVARHAAMVARRVEQLTA